MKRMNLFDGRLEEKKQFDIDLQSIRFTLFPVSNRKRRAWHLDSGFRLDTVRRTVDTDGQYTVLKTGFLLKKE